MKKTIAAAPGQNQMDVEFTTEEIAAREAEIEAVRKYKQESAYRYLRKSEYPPIEDYLDAKVKQSSADLAIRDEGALQEQTYIQQCLEVKLKYQKPVIEEFRNGK